MALGENPTFVNADEPRKQPTPAVSAADKAAADKRAAERAAANDPTVVHEPGSPRRSPYETDEKGRVEVEEKEVPALDSFDSGDPLAPKSPDPEHHEPPHPDYPELDDEPAKPAQKYVPPSTK